MEAFLIGLKNHFHASALASEMAAAAGLSIVQMHQGEAPPGTSMPWVTLSLTNSDFEDDTDGNQTIGRDVEMTIRWYDSDTLNRWGDKLRRLFTGRRIDMPTGHIMDGIPNDEAADSTGLKDEQARLIHLYAVAMSFKEFQRATD